MAGILIVYFSRTGATEMAAGALAQRLGADLDFIRTGVDYAGAGGWLRGVWQSLVRSGPKISHGRDPAPYDLVVLGFPIWAGRLAGPMRSYLRRNAKRLARTAAFCVSGSGMGYGEAFAEIAGLGASAPMATLSLSEGKVRDRHMLREIDAFAQALEPPPLTAAA